MYDVGVKKFRQFPLGVFFFFISGFPTFSRSFVHSILLDVGSSIFSEKYFYVFVHILECRAQNIMATIEKSR